MPDYNGLTRNQWPGTWSPSSNHPIVLDTEIRGGLRYVSGDVGDRLSDITGQRLQDGMVVYVENGYTEGTVTYQSGQYYKFNVLAGESRDASTGVLPNDSDNWEFFKPDVSGLVYDSSSGLLTISTNDGNTFTDSINLNPFSTSNLSEGTNKYYTTARSDSDFDIRLATKSTTNLSEGNNLYYTTTRVDSAFDARFDSSFDERLTTKSTTNLSEGSNLYYTDERVDDRVNALVQDGDGITTLYEDGPNKLTFSIGNDAIKDTMIDFGTGTNQVSTDDVPEGTNLYFTTARADSDAKHAISGGTGISYSSDTGTIATNDAEIDHNSLLNHSSDEHIAHSGVSIVAGKGLSGGGTIDLSRTIDIDSANVRGMFSGSNGITYNSGTGDIRAAQPLDSSANPTFNQLRGPANFVIDPATIGDATGTVQILGNLQVDGTTTTINSTNVSVNDKTFTIADSAPDSSGLAGAGIIWGGALITTNRPSFKYNHAQERFDANRTISATSFTGSLSAGNLTGIIDSARIPSLATSDIVTGTFDSSRLPSLAASDIVTGTFSDARIPNLSADKITSNVFDSARIPAIKIDANRISSGTIDSARIPTLKIDDLANTTDITSVGTLTGLTSTGDVIVDSANGFLFDVSDTSLKFGDGYKASFGAGNDLQISHTGLQSVIEDAGAGSFVLRTNNMIQLDAGSASTVMAKFKSQPVELYYNGTKRFETTDSGVSVTGSILADSATIPRIVIQESADGDFVMADQGDGRVDFGYPTTFGPAVEMYNKNSGVASGTRKGRIGLTYGGIDGTGDIVLTHRTSSTWIQRGVFDAFGNFQMDGKLTADSATITGDVSAATFTGSGANLTNLPAGQLTDTIDSARIPTLKIADLANTTDIDHDTLTNFDLDEHINHANVSIIAGKGLSGGGTIASSRTIDIDSANIRGMFSGGTGITYSSGTGAISTTDADIVHNDLSGFEPNEHIDHTSVSISTGTGLSGGGDISSTRTLKIDSSELASLYSKVIAHDNTSGFVEDEHIDHSSVSIIAGKGLSGGGTIASSRTIDIDSANVDVIINSNLAGSSVLIDGNGSTGGITISDGLIDMRTGTGSVSKIKFYCEASNAHFQTLQAAPHDSASSAVLVLPKDSGTLALRTDIIDSAAISSIITADVDADFINALTIDADTLGTVSSTSFLRSDAADEFSGVLTATAPIEFNGGVTYDPSSSGSGNDTATDVAISLASGQRIVGHGSGYIRNLLEWNQSSALEIGQNNTALINHTKIYGGSGSGVELYEGNVKKLETTATGVAITGAITSTDSAIFGGDGSTGGVKIDDGAITIFSGTGSPGYIDFYCETSNQHRVRVKSDLHTNYADNVELILPTSKLTGTILTDSSTATLLNKTISADSNTLSNIEVDNFKASAIVTEGDGIGSNDNDTTLPTSAAVKDYVDNNAGGGGIALTDLSVTTASASGGGSLSYNNSTGVFTFAPSTNSGGGGGGGTPGGSNTQVQFNDGGSFGGDAGMTFNKTTGVFAATSKSFDIDHPTKEGMRLRYGSLEGPENGVYVRGRLTGSNTIELPDYWTGLIHEDTITVTLTPIGKPQDLYVEDIGNNQVIIGGEDINCFYVVYGERKDVEKITVEYDK